MARVAFGGFQHETDTFAPLTASWADFEPTPGRPLRARRNRYAVLCQRRHGRALRTVADRSLSVL